MSSNNNLPDFVKNYLARFSFSKWNLHKEDYKSYDNVIVIPSLAESEIITNCIKSLEINNWNILDKTLIIVVINNSEDAPSDIAENNKKTFELLSNYNGKLNINFVDAFSKQRSLPQKLAGVGFARKIGLDLALTKFDYESHNKKILIWLDADSEVESNYLEVITERFNKENLSSAVIEYEHKIIDNQPEAKAIICYETFLRYFRLALIYAKFHFDYHAIGSTIVCDVESYTKASGMNSKQAGEDFYFLEKLAKQNKVTTITETLVYPSPRKSWRVPFGTGQRITRYLQQDEDEYFVYNPKSFELLKEWLEFFYSDFTIETSSILKQAKEISIHLHSFLIAQGFEKSWNKILRNSDSSKEIRKQKIFWFDAFRTLKLIHYLRDNIFPNINTYDALKILLKNFQMPNDYDFEKAKTDYQTQKQILISLRNFFRNKL